MNPAIFLAMDMATNDDPPRKKSTKEPRSSWVTRLRPTRDPLVSLLEPPDQADSSQEIEGYQRPVGYEDRKDRRPSTRKDWRERLHPKQYNTDWATFTSPSTSTSLASRTSDTLVFNIRISNIDESLSDAEIESFLKTRCNGSLKLRAVTVAHRKEVHLALSDGASQRRMRELDGMRLGRNCVKVEWSPAGFTSGSD